MIFMEDQVEGDGHFLLYIAELFLKEKVMGGSCSFSLYKNARSFPCIVIISRAFDLYSYKIGKYTIKLNFPTDSRVFVFYLMVL